MPFPRLAPRLSESRSGRGPRPTRRDCAGGLGPAPALDPGVQTPSLEGSDGCPGPSGASGSQGRAGAPSAAAATSSLAGPRHPAPPSPGAALGPRRAPAAPETRGRARGRALRRWWRSAPGAAARGRVLPRAFPAAGHVLGAPEGAGCSPASRASWLRLRRELPGCHCCRRCSRRSRPPPAFAAAAAAADAQQPGSARPRAPLGTARRPPRYCGWVSRAKLKSFRSSVQGSTMTPRQHHTVISAVAGRGGRGGGGEKAIPTKRGMGWGRSGLGLLPRGSAGKGPAARALGHLPRLTFCRPRRSQLPLPLLWRRVYMFSPLAGVTGET